MLVVKSFEEGWAQIKKIAFDPLEVEIMIQMSLTFVFNVKCEKRFLQEGDTVGHKSLFTNQDYLNVYTYVYYIYFISFVVSLIFIIITPTCSICYNMCSQKTPYNWASELYSRRDVWFSNYLQVQVLPALQNLPLHDFLVEFCKRVSQFKILNRWHCKFFSYLVRFEFISFCTNIYENLL